jgi:hypothetical protein
VAISGSRQTDRLFCLASLRVSLHRVVLGDPSIRSGDPLPEAVMLSGRWGRTPTRIARRLTRQRQLTRAMTDSCRAAPPTRAASGASTELQPFAAPWSRLAIQPLAAQRSSASISFSMASRVDAVRSRKRRACLLSWGQRMRRTAVISGLRPQGQPRHRIISRVRCIACFHFPFLSTHDQFDSGKNALHLSLGHFPHSLDQLPLIDGNELRHIGHRIVIELRLVGSQQHVAWGYRPPKVACEENTNNCGDLATVERI